MCVHAHMFVCVHMWASMKSSYLSPDSIGLFLALFALEPVFG